MAVVEFFNSENVGAREMKEAIGILQAWLDNKWHRDVEDPPENDDFKICYNTDSGFVFMLTLEDERVFLLDDGYLNEWFMCSNCGDEGFIDEFEEGFDRYEMICGKCKREEEEEEEE